MLGEIPDEVELSDDGWRVVEEHGFGFCTRYEIQLVDLVVNII